MPETIAKAFSCGIIPTVMLARLVFVAVQQLESRNRSKKPMPKLNVEVKGRGRGGCIGRIAGLNRSLIFAQ
jgi:hypothetical protein